MKIKEGATVLTADDQKVGRIERVVIDPRTREITHLVVRQGFLVTEDKVMSLDLVETVGQDRLLLNREADDMPDLPPFEETHFVPLDNQEIQQTYPLGYVRPIYWYPPMTSTPPPHNYPADYVGYTGPPYDTQIKRNIPDDTVPLKEGAKVISYDAAHVGDVEQVFTHPTTDQATHFVISQGWLLKERKVVPLNWLNSISEEQVQLAVNSRIIENLPAYDEA